jgi:hypothetical protein
VLSLPCLTLSPAFPTFSPRKGFAFNFLVLVWTLGQILSLSSLSFHLCTELMGCRATPAPACCSHQLLAQSKRAALTKTRFCFSSLPNQRCCAGLH